MYREGRVCPAERAALRLASVPKERDGWQAILNSFKADVEASPAR
jgi:hypothetical protein